MSRNVSREDAMLRRVFANAIVASSLVVLLLPAAASAQSSITGLVKDASGAVLPGVTVEASSPALIEKVRTAVTDGTGQYRVENLRPGTYTVIYTSRASGCSSITSTRARISTTCSNPARF